MNAPALIKVSVPSLEMSEGELIRVLESSVYPGAAIESIKLVIGYCRAQLLDPLQKPVHIVPMDVKVKDDQGKEKWVKRDVIMPGIGLYRIQAARTGQYAGMSPPEFGPTKKLTWTEQRDDGQGGTSDATREIEYPEWCQISVFRMVDGQRCEFPAREYWLENYATKGRGSKAPNAMWSKRSIGQLAKCAEAQALRKGFPEVGSQPTADEMEGKTIDADGGVTIDNATGAIAHSKPAVEMPQSKRAQEPPAQPQSADSTSSPSGGADPTGQTQQSAGAAPTHQGPRSSASQGVGPAGGEDSKPLSEGAKQRLRMAMQRAARSEADLIAAGFGEIEKMQFSRFNDVMEWVKKNPAVAAS